MAAKLTLERGDVVIVHYMLSRPIKAVVTKDYDGIGTWIDLKAEHPSGEWYDFFALAAMVGQCKD